MRSPINLATDIRYGGEFTTTYTPKKDWRLSLNVNLFQQEVRGDFSFINSQNIEILQNFDADNFTWFGRLSAKIPLPGGIEFQTNTFYRGRRVDAQNINRGILSTNLAFSRDIIKNKASLSLNISDFFNSRRRTTETRTDNVFTESEFQFRQRQTTLTFSYRFNQQQGDGRNRRRRQNGGDDNFDFEGNP